MQRSGSAALPALALLLSPLALARAEEPPAPAPPAAVRWRAFGPEAFKEAAASDRLVLINLSASWDYGSRVMADTTYADPEVIRLLEERFVPVLVDTDERPDLFVRYGLDAWPSTAVTLPDGLPLHYPDPNARVTRAGGLFFPPGRFRAYFGQLADYYAANRTSARAASSRAEEMLLEKRNVAEGKVEPEALEAVIGRILDSRRADPAEARPDDGQPNFGMVELAFYYYFRKADRSVLDAALDHLTDLARGGIRDHLGGGFHRYARDPGFIVPCFEKLPSTNAEAMKAFFTAYEVTGHPRFQEIAEQTLAHVERHGVDPVTGAFVGAMAAGRSSGDNGDYYTWTEEEARAALGEEEFKIAAAAFDIGAAGEMLDSAPKRNVLFLAAGPKLLAPVLKQDEKQVGEILERAKAALLREREKRPAPPVDGTSYGDWSGRMASAYLQAAATLERPALAAKAGRALSVLLETCRDDRGLVAHVCRPDRGERGALPFLADQAHVAAALLDAYEQDGSGRWLKEARAIAERAAPLYADALSGGFSDRIVDPNGPGLLAWPGRDINDNMAMVRVLIRLGRLTGEGAYLDRARKVLESWADEFGRFGEWAAPYAMASQMLLAEPLEVLVVAGKDESATAAASARALRLYHPWRIVRHFDPSDGAGALRKRGLKPIEGEPQVAFCVGAECAGPYAAGESLRPKLDAFLNPGRASGSAKGD